MGKKLIFIFILLAIGLVAYNVTLVDFKNPFEGDSTVALIGVIASLCAIVLLMIFLVSKRIQDKLNKD